MGFNSVFKGLNIESKITNFTLHIHNMAQNASGNISLLEVLKILGVNEF